MLLPKLRFPEFQNDGEWKKKALNKLGKLVNGLTYSPDDVKDEGLLVLRSSNIQNGIIVLDDNVYVRSDVKGANLSETNDILICVRNGSKALIGKNALIPTGMALCTHGAFMTVFRSDKSKFVFQLFQTKAYATKVACDLGATINSINASNFLKYEFLVPENPDEQNKIAAFLSSLDEVIIAESQELEVLKEHKRGLLQCLLPVGAETIPKFRFEEFQNRDEWSEDTLLNIASFRRGSFPQPYGLPKWYDDENGMPFIQVFDVGEDFCLKPTTKSRISELAAKQSVFIPKGTLIITLQGSIGRVAITQYDAYIDRTLLLFEEFHIEIDLNFFAYTIFLLFEIEKQKAPGGIIKTITKDVLSSFVVKMPSIEEQKKIASCLTSLDELINVQSQKIEALKHHKKGLLQGLFPNINEITE